MNSGSGSGSGSDSGSGSGGMDSGSGSGSGSGTSCDPAAIKEGLTNPILPPHVSVDINAACPALDGEEHSEQQDCECARTVRENADLLRWIPAMHCKIEGN